MARTDRRRTKIGVDVEVRSSGRSKGGGGTQVVPVLTLEEERERRGRGGKQEDRRRVRTERLLEAPLEEVTALAKRTAVGDRVTVLGSGPRLVVLSPRGVLGLATPEASETIRTALRTTPGAWLECLVGAVDEHRPRIDVTLLRPASCDRCRIERRAARPVEEPAVDEVAAVAAAGRRGR